MDPDAATEQAFKKMALGLALRCTNDAAYIPRKEDFDAASNVAHVVVVHDKEPYSQYGFDQLAERFHSCLVPPAVVKIVQPYWSPDYLRLCDASPMSLTDLFQAVIDKQRRVAQQPSTLFTIAVHRAEVYTPGQRLPVTLDRPLDANPDDRVEVIGTVCRHGVSNYYIHCKAQHQAAIRAMKGELYDLARGFEQHLQDEVARDDECIFVCNEETLRISAFGDAMRLCEDLGNSVSCCARCQETYLGQASQEDVGMDQSELDDALSSASSPVLPPMPPPPALFV